MGLIIGDRQIEGTDADFTEVLKPVLAPGSDASGRAGISDAAEPLTLQIIDAMMNDNIVHTWPDIGALAENISLRSAVIEEMRQIGSGYLDCNYAMPAQGISPVLGKCNNWIWFRRHEKGVSSERRNELRRDMNRYWREVGYDSFVFEAAEAPVPDCVADTIPFRGECQGAMQLSILRGAKKALGNPKLKALAERIGVPAFIGSSHVPAGRLPRSATKGVYTLANRFLDYHRMPTDYKRGEILGIPGDYFYYKNIDIYLAFSLGKGAWQGENTIYVGADYAGIPHYTGMGLSSHPEILLNLSMANAVYHDCNLPFIEDWRNDRPLTWPFIYVQESYDLRFTLRGVLRVPDAESAEIPELIPMPEVMQISAPVDMEDRLGALGAVPDKHGLWQHPGLSFGTLSHAFKLRPEHLMQTPSSPMYGPSLSARVGDWYFVLHPLEPEANPGHPETELGLQCIRVLEGF